MKATQENFFEIVQRVITPEPSRRAPVFWIRELAILKSLEPGVEHEVRRMKLHKGLNILWAPPEQMRVARMYEDGLAGHASGKTLFCRLLRFVLGESNFGNSSLQKSVREVFPELWALAEVEVDGHLWLVVRPMSPQQGHKAAVRDCTIDRYLQQKPDTGKYDEFSAALERAVAGNFKGADKLDWRYLLPWLTRDQECRFSSLTDWRNTAVAESEKPLCTVADQQNLMRAVLGLFNSQESVLQQELDSLQQTTDKLEEELPRLERDASKAWNTVVTRLRQVDIRVVESDSAESIKQKADNMLAVLVDSVKLGQEDAAFQSAVAAVQSIKQEQAALHARITDLGNRVDKGRRDWGEKAKRLQSIRERGIENPERRDAGFCPHTLAHAIERGCASGSANIELESASILGELMLENENLQRQLESDEKQLALYRTQDADLDRRLVDANAKKAAESARVDVARCNATNRQAALGSIIDFYLPECLAAQGSLQSTTAAVEENRQRMSAIRSDLALIRRSREGDIQKVSELFADVVGAAIGEVKAEVVEGERGLTLRAKRRGDLSGAALDTVKVIAFDIAAMTASIEGRGFHPRFLIHDGPREADMDQVIYERFFLYAQKLEKSYGNAEPAFQYIITTTTPPPPDMQEDGNRWMLRPILSGSDEKRRLLGVNL